MEPTHNVTYYFDMDGVIVKYEYGAYNGTNPLYRRPGSHYYKDLEPDERMLQAVKKLTGKLTSKNCIRIITQVCNEGDIFLEQIQDKKAWLAKYLPEIDLETQFIATPFGKEKTIRCVTGHPLTKRHILIDDWKKNLESWENMGGMPVKYINHLNSVNKTLQGLNLTPEMTSNDICTALLLLGQNLPLYET